MASDLSRYVSATGGKLKRKAFSSKSFAQLNTSASGHELSKVLGAWDLTFLGIGGIIGAGVFVLTGVAAKNFAGPGVVFSYLVASISAILSAFCYTEFAVETPVAGGAYLYISMVFGELAGWISASNLVLEYTLSSAAVARSFTSYTATLFGLSPNGLRIPVNDSDIFMLDIPAVIVIVALSFLLASGTQGGARFNTGVTILNIVVIVFVLGAGLPRFKSANFHPLLPFGWHGVFAGASKVFFSFIGFDTVATAAEETKNPAFDLPMGIVMSLVICSGLYVAMCVTICGMVYYTMIDVNAPFATAFVNIDMKWASHVVSLGAVAGIVTSLLVNLLGQARIWMVLGREHLVPPWLAQVHEHTRTPVHATIVTAFTASVFALLVDLEALADLVSIGTLSVFFMVSSACLWKRYQSPAEPVRPLLLLKFLLFVALCFALSIAYTAKAPTAVTLVLLTLWVLSVTLFLREPVAFVPKRFTIPLTPVSPCLAILANVFLITSLGYYAYIRFAVWFVLSLVVYLLYGVHHSAEPGGSDPGEVVGGGNGFRVAADDPFLDDVNFLDADNFSSAIEMARQSPGTRTPRRAPQKARGKDAPSAAPAEYSAVSNGVELPES